MKVAVLGSGGWGTALALLLLENGNEVTLWSHTQAESTVLQETRVNPLLPEIKLPEALVLTSEFACVQTCDVVVMAVPSFAVRETA